MGMSQRNEHQTSESAEEQIKEVEDKVGNAELEIYTGEEGKGRDWARGSIKVCGVRV